MNTPQPVDLPEIRVQHSGVVRLQCFDDSPDGLLVIAEAERSVPFQVRRIYVITALQNGNAVRGRHAHRTLEQCIFCISGSFMLELDDGRTAQSIVLADPSLGVKLGPRLWHTMSRFSPGCVLLVLASAYYDSRDYIRDYVEFLELVRA